MRRVLSLDGNESKHAKWKNARFLAQSNPVTAPWSRDDVLSFAVKSKQPVFMVPAVDEPTGKRKLFPSDLKRLRAMPDNKTKNLPVLLPIVRGMRIVLRYNVATELGLTNGAEGTVVSIMFNSNELLPDTVYNTKASSAPVVCRLQYQPVAIMVEFDSLDLLRPLPNMPQKHRIPIFPRQDYFTYVCPARSGQKQFQCSVSRTQFPLIPSRGLTAHLAQGKTVPIFVVDLDLMNVRCDKLATMYVLLSRGQRFRDIRLLRPFHHALLHIKPPWWRRQELQRLFDLQKKTMSLSVDSGHTSGERSLLLADSLSHLPLRAFRTFTGYARCGNVVARGQCRSFITIGSCSWYVSNVKAFC